MANEEKRISISAIERAVKESDDADVVQIEWRGETIPVKRRLNLAEMMAFVDGVASNVFSDDGSYVPEVEGLLRRSAILELYGSFRLPQNIEHRYELLYSPVMRETADMILEQVDQVQYEEILDAIRDRIDYRMNTDIEKANRKVNELISSLLDMESTFKGILGDVSQDDVRALLSSLTKGVDEEKIVNAYMDRKEQHDAAPITFADDSDEDTVDNNQQDEDATEK